MCWALGWWTDPFRRAYFLDVQAGVATLREIGKDTEVPYMVFSLC